MTIEDLNMLADLLREFFKQDEWPLTYNDVQGYLHILARIKIFEKVFITNDEDIACDKLAELLGYNI